VTCVSSVGQVDCGCSVGQVLRYADNETMDGVVISLSKWNMTEPPVCMGHLRGTLPLPNREFVLETSDGHAFQGPGNVSVTLDLTLVPDVI
jgi:hypothetical protein